MNDIIATVIGATLGTFLGITLFFISVILIERLL